MINLEVSMKEIRAIRSALNRTVLSFWEEKDLLKRRMRKILDETSKPKQFQLQSTLDHLYEELQIVNNRLEDAMAMENKIDHAVRNQTGENV